LWQLTAIGVGGIIGVGTFTLAGLVANGGDDGTPVGPAVLISFLVAGLASAAAALSYAEFAGMIPRAGSAYTYGYVALGEIIGWFIGWDLLLEYTAIVAVVAIGISGYFTEFMSGIGVIVPTWMQGTSDTIEGGVVNVRLRVLPGARFKARGSDLRGDLRINARRAAQGGTEIMLGPVGAPMPVGIPAGIGRGAIVRLRGEGLPKPRGGRGDLLVRITYRPEVHISRTSGR